jgi:hypothetical protein
LGKKIVTNGLDRIGQGRSHHDHTWAASIGPVINGLVRIVYELPRIPEPEAHKVSVKRSAADAKRRPGFKELWKDRDNIETEKRSCRQWLHLDGPI